MSRITTGGDRDVEVSTHPTSKEQAMHIPQIKNPSLQFSFQPADATTQQTLYTINYRNGSAEDNFKIPASQSVRI